ncbi:MAG: hypothetical protein AB7N76_13775 [Planctomycetota bacterium]
MRRRISILEIMVALSLFTLLFGLVVPSIARSLEARRVLAAWASDLEGATVSADALRREVREATGVAIRSADGAFATSGDTLVLQRGDEQRVLRVEEESNVTWLVRYRLSPGAAPGRELLCQASALRLRFDVANPVTSARAVGFDIVLPRRTPGAAERALSSRVGVNQ